MSSRYLLRQPSFAAIAEIEDLAMTRPPMRLHNIRRGGSASLDKSFWCLFFLHLGMTGLISGSRSSPPILGEKSAIGGHSRNFRSGRWELTSGGSASGRGCGYV